MKRCLACAATFAAADWRCPHCGREPQTIDGFRAFAPALAAGASGYDPAHFAELSRLEAGNFWFRARNRLLVWALRRYFPDCRSFLEVGCGSGFVLAGIAAAFPRARLVAGEASTDGLLRAAARVPAAELLQIDARSLPYRDEFDVVGAFDVIEHIADDAAVLAALRAAAVPGGGLLLTVPQHPFLWSEFDVRSGHLRRYRAAQLRERLVEAGFDILTMTSFTTLLLPAMLLSRLARRRPAASYDPVDELRLPRWLDALLQWVLDLERLLIRAGLRLPAGGSLLVVARRRPDGPLSRPRDA
jgi:SAM-dependent methyltransferase